MNKHAGTLTKIEELLTSPKRDGKDSYRQIIEIAMSRLQRLTQVMMRSYPQLRRWEQTDDVFQTAVIKLYRSLKEIKPSSSREFLGLATLQIRRTLIDLARHHFGPQAAAAQHESHDGLADVTEGRTDASDGPATLAQWAEFHEAVEQLPNDEREVFSLSWYAAATQKEIAELLSVSEKTVQRRFYRARLQLVELFDTDALE